MLGLISAKKYAVQKILILARYSGKREIHSRNRKATELIAKGWNALKEVDRVVDHTKYDDARLYPLLRTAKRNFELALETDNSNTHARYWLARLHLNYYVPGRCRAVGAALLVEAADMGDPDAQYELALQLRGDNGGYVQMDEKALNYLQKAVDQLHPSALYLMGTIYLTGDCVKKDISKALWCFHRASEKGHPGAAISYGALLLRDLKLLRRLSSPAAMAVQPSPNSTDRPPPAPDPRPHQADVYNPNSTGLDGTGKISFASMVARPTILPRFPEVQLAARQYGVKDGMPSVAFSRAEYQAMTKRFSHTLIAKFQMGRPPMATIRDFMLKSWTPEGRATISSNWDDRHVVIILDSEKDVTSALTFPVRKVCHTFFRLFRWSPDYNQWRIQSFV
ncbi:unnamed protein product [Rhodiola kirilowii]